MTKRRASIGAVLVLAILVGSAIILPYHAAASSTSSLTSVAIPVGQNPAASAFDPENGYVYIANCGSNSVSAIDPANQTVVATYALGGPVERCPDSIAYISSVGELVVSFNWGLLMAAVINVATNQVQDVYWSQGDCAAAVAYDPVENLIFRADNCDGVVFAYLWDGTNLVPQGGPITVGNGPDAMTYDASNGELYVANQWDGTVSVIAPWNQSVVATIPVGSSPQAIEASGGSVYVANAGSADVSVIDASTNTVVATTAVGEQPDALAVDAQDGNLYVGDGASGTVYVIDTQLNVVIQGIAVGDNPSCLAFDPVVDAVYVCMEYSNSVAVITANGVLLAGSVAIPDDPWGIAYDSETGDLFIANRGYDTVSVIDPTTNQLVATVAAPEPDTVAYDNVTGTVYAVDSAGSNVTAISAFAPYSTITVPTGSDPSGIAIDTSNGEAYLTNFFDSTITALDGTSATSYSLSTPGCYPSAIAYDSQSDLLYVACMGLSEVLEFDPTTGSLAGPPIPDPAFPGGFEPVAMAYDPAEGTIFVAASDADDVFVLSGSSVIASGIPVGAGPSAIAYDPADGSMYVVGQWSNSVTEISGTTAGLNATPTYSVRSENGSYNEPIALAVDGYTGSLYVTNMGSSTLTVLPGPGGTPVPFVTDFGATTGSFGTGFGPDAIAYDPADNLVYVANQGSDSVSVYDPVGRGLVATVGNVGPSCNYGRGGPTSLNYTDGAVFATAGNCLYEIAGLGIAATFPVPYASCLGQPMDTQSMAVSVGPGGDLFVGQSYPVTYTTTTGPGGAAQCAPASYAPYVSVLSPSGGVLVHPTPIGPGNGTIVAALGEGLTLAGGTPGAAVFAIAGPNVLVRVTSLLLASSPLPLPGVPSGMCYDPENEALYVATEVNGNGLLYNFGGLSPLGNTTIGIDGSAVGCAYDDATGLLFVTQSSDSVAVVNPYEGPSGTQVYSVDLAFELSSATSLGTRAIAWDPNAPNGGLLFVADLDQGAVSMMLGYQRESTLPASAGGCAFGSNCAFQVPIGIVYDPVDQSAYVLNQATRAVTVINAISSTITATIPLGYQGFPWSIALGGANGDVYVSEDTLSGPGYVDVIDPGTNSIADSIWVGAEPSGMAWDSANGDLYVADTASNNVSVVDGSSDTVIATVALNTTSPMTVGYDPVANAVLVYDMGGNFSSSYAWVDVISGTNLTSGGSYLQGSCQSWAIGSVVTGSACLTSTSGSPGNIQFDAWAGADLLVNGQVSTVGEARVSAEGALSYYQTNGGYPVDAPSAPLSTWSAWYEAGSATPAVGNGPADQGVLDLVPNFYAHSVGVVAVPFGASSGGNRLLYTAGSFTVGGGASAVAYDPTYHYDESGSAYVTNTADSTVTIISGL